MPQACFNNNSTYCWIPYITGLYMVSRWCFENVCMFLCVSICEGCRRVPGRVAKSGTGTECGVGVWNHCSEVSYGTQVWRVPSHRTLSSLQGNNPTNTTKSFLVLKTCCMIWFGLYCSNIWYVTMCLFRCVCVFISQNTRIKEGIYNINPEEEPLRTELLSGKFTVLVTTLKCICVSS